MIGDYKMLLKKKNEEITKPKRVLMVLTALGVSGGVQNKVMDLYKEVDKTRIQFDFLVHTKDIEGSFEETIELMGGKVYFFGKFNDIGLFTYIRSEERRVGKECK